MPVRSYRIRLSNNTNFDLVRTAHVLCPALGGDPIWTSSAWEPPLTIPVRSERAWQSESNGIAVGTSGFVKYRRAIPPEVIPGGPPPPPTLAEEIYIYWVNPYTGGVPGSSPPTKAKCAIDIVQVKLDCDPDGQPSSNSGAFTNPQSQFEIKPDLLYDSNHPDWTPGRSFDSDPNFAFSVLAMYAGGELAGAVGVIIAGIQRMINNAAIQPHAESVFTVCERGSVRQGFSLTYNPANGIRPVIGPKAASLRTVFRMQGG